MSNIKEIYPIGYHGVKVDLLKSNQVGSRVFVKVNKFKLKKDKETKKKYFAFVGQYESFAGFKKLKDFDYAVAERLAITNAINQEKVYDD